MDLLQRQAITRARAALAVADSSASRPLYSFQRVLEAVEHGRTIGGYEAEINEELHRQGHVPSRGGVMVPLDEFFGRALGTTTAAAGGSLLALLPFTDYARELGIEPAVIRLGATVVPDLKSDGFLPRLDSGLTGTWIAEGTAPAEGSSAFGQVALKAKTVSAFIDFTRRLGRQSSLGIDNLLRENIGRALARSVDQAALIGDGNAQPLGIVNQTGIGLVAIGANGGALSRTVLRSIIQDLADRKAINGDSRLGFAINSKTALANYATETVATSGRYLYEPTGASGGLLGGWPAAIDDHLPSTGTKGTGSNLSTLVAGDWRQVLIGFFGAVEFLVDPFLQAKNGIIRLTAFLDVAIAASRPEAFVKVDDIVTT